MKHDDFQDIVRVSERVSEFQLSFQMRLCQYHVPWQPGSKRQLEVFTAEGMATWRSVYSR